MIARRWLTALLALVAAGVANAAECPRLLDREFERLQDGTPQSLCDYRGKVVLVVNTASYCGFTYQYDGLERIGQRFAERGLVVLGFPSNDFGAQEPASNREIAEFCRTTYGVGFPMFAKSSVVGASANPLFRDLAEATGVRPGWNFHKYLIDRSGTRIESFASTVGPESDQLVAAIEARLAEVPASSRGVR